MEAKKKSLIPFFTKGDVGGLTYMITNNIVNYIIIIATLEGFGWPSEIIFGRVIPGLSIGLMCGGLYYAWMARKLSAKLERPDVTALPSGISTPAMFVILFGVISPIHYAIGDPETEWGAAMAACFIGGFVEFLGGFIGPWVKKHLPRAALLGTVAGIGFIWMATQGVFDVFGDPVVGLPILAVAMLGLFAGYLFPKKISPFMVAIVGGIVYAICLGRTTFDFTQVGFYFPNPVNTIQSLVNGFAYVAPYLTVVIPVEIYNFIETMDNVESANAAGDPYNVREAQFADGCCTMISSLFGGVVPNTVWLGHPGLKKTNAGAAYSWISGVVLGLAGIFGLFTVLDDLVPPAVVAITFLWWHRPSRNASRSTTRPSPSPWFPPSPTISSRRWKRLSRPVPWRKAAGASGPRRSIPASRASSLRSPKCSSPTARCGTAFPRSRPARSSSASCSAPCASS